jgi:hypothetical protein
MFRALLCPSSGDKKTRLVKTSCEATCNIERESLGSIVVDTVSCGIVKVMRLCQERCVDIVCTVTLPYCGFSVEVFLCYESRGACSVGVSKYILETPCIGNKINPISSHSKKNLSFTPHVKR